MLFKDVANLEERAVLTAVLNDLCLAAGIDAQSSESKPRRRSPPRKKLTGNKANVERVKLSTIPEAR